MPRVNKKTTSSGKTATKAKTYKIGVVAKSKNGKLGSIFNPVTSKVEFKPNWVGQYVIVATKTPKSSDPRKKPEPVTKFVRDFGVLVGNIADAKMFPETRAAYDFLDKDKTKGSYTLKVAQITNIGHYATIEY